MEFSFDVRVDRATYCPDCDTVGNSPERCPRCAGRLVPLHTLLKPMGAAAPVKLGEHYKIKVGYMDEDVDGPGYMLKDTVAFTKAYASCAEALEDFQSVYPEAVERSDVMYRRIAGVEVVYYASFTHWAVVKIV
jgi:hypothetical protein